MSEARHAIDETAAPDEARYGSGLATVYQALDRLVAVRGLADAAVVVEVAPLGRQVLRAGRRPLRGDEQGLLTRATGLYLDPEPDPEHASGDDGFVAELMVALAELGLRHDVARLAATAPELVAGAEVG